MIERMPRKIASPLIGLLRASTTSSQSLSASIYTYAYPYPQPRHSPCSIRRFYASPTPETQPPSPQFPQENGDASHSIPPPPPPPPPKRSLRPLIYATAFFLLGAMAGHYVRLVIAPPPLPTLDSDADHALRVSIRALAAKQPVVASLTRDPAWRSWDAYSDKQHQQQRQQRFTSGPLAGTRGLGAYQRVFHNAATGEVVVVVWIGGALAGWPGVVHGGVSAALLDETMGRCAIALLPAHTAVTANLDLNYRKPALTNAFYVVRATPVPEEGSTERKGFVRGSLETLDGKVCVEAKGLFVVPTRLPLLSPAEPVELNTLDEGF